TVTASGPQYNVAAVSGVDQIDPNPLNDRSTPAVNAPGTPGIAGEKAGSNPAPAGGQQGTYPLPAHNTRPRAARGVDGPGVMPAGLTFVSASASRGTYDSGTGVWTIGALPLTANALLTVTATVTGTGTIVNTAVRQTSSPVDTNPANDTASATITAARVADL